MKLSLSHWYPGSGVVLDCIDSGSLPSFLFDLYVLIMLFWKGELLIKNTILGEQIASQAFSREFEIFKFGKSTLGYN